MRGLYLVGFMAAGKTSIGQLLADRLDARFVDLDRYLEDRLGMSIREVFGRFGEDRFRSAEREALRWSSTLERAVIATGGGAFCCEENRAIIDAGGGQSIFLDVPWPALAARLRGDQSERPKFGDLEAARQLHERRREHYRLATWTVRLEGSETPEVAVDRILGVLAGAAACGS